PVARRPACRAATSSTPLILQSRPTTMADTPRSRAMSATATPRDRAKDALISPGAMPYMPLVLNAETAKACGGRETACSMSGLPKVETGYIVCRKGCNSRRRMDVRIRIARFFVCYEHRSDDLVLGVLFSRT